jgi:cytoskeletal protein RodZ
MIDSSAGKKLSQARLAKQLTIDEVAHATKLRPDKIVALENDDFSRFGSIAYGKGFLQIYARYLGIDLSEQLRALEVPTNTVSISDYQYLNTPHPPAPKQHRDRTLERGGARRERKPPSVLPLFVVLGLGAIGLYGWYSMNATRLQPAPSMAGPTPAAAVAPSALPEPPREEKPATGVNKLPGSARPVKTAGSDEKFLAANTPSASRTSENLDTGVMNELIVEPLKKTWVKIRKDSLDSAPIFEDYLYPRGGALKLRGAKFFVEVRDETAVQIRKNGHPIAYQPPGISVP